MFWGTFSLENLQRSPLIQHVTEKSQKLEKYTRIFARVIKSIAIFSTPELVTVFIKNSNMSNRSEHQPYCNCRI